MKKIYELLGIRFTRFMDTLDVSYTTAIKKMNLPEKMDMSEIKKIADSLGIEPSLLTELILKNKITSSPEKLRQMNEIYKNNIKSLIDEFTQ